MQQGSVGVYETVQYEYIQLDCRVCEQVRLSHVLVCQELSLCLARGGKGYITYLPFVYKQIHTVRTIAHPVAPTWLLLIG